MSAKIIQFPLPDELITERENLFFMKVKGTSMSQANIHDGDHVLLRSTAILKDGKVMVVRVDGVSCLKRVRLQNDFVHLCWEDGSGKRVVVRPQDVQVQGELVVTISYDYPKEPLDLSKMVPLSSLGYSFAEWRLKDRKSKKGIKHFAFPVGGGKQNEL